MYEPNWQSLAAHSIPEWMSDARFGIWSHWGPQSVPRSGDWYARHLYGVQASTADWERKRATRQAEYHRRHYGDPAEFGYKDILPLWKAEKFDPEALVDRYRRAGARYIMSMGVHCDNFALWDSAVHPWNSARVGPKRDILGEWERATRNAGLPFGVSFHNNWTWKWLDVVHGADAAGRPNDGAQTSRDGVGLWWEGLEPQDLYLPPRTAGTPASAEWMRRHWEMIREVTSRYRPDAVYFDDQRLPFDDGSEAVAERPTHDGLAYLAWYYEQARLWDDLPFAHGIVTIKKVAENEHGAVMLDSERKALNGPQSAPWQFDSSDGEWFDCADSSELFHPRKSARQVIQLLADVVSKNGILLLNIPQRADGTLDEHAGALLDELEEWMDVAGEAIHGARPWRIHGEGPTASDDSEQNDEDQLPYTPRDIRFTMSGDALYAILLAWPEAGSVVITSLAGPTTYRVNRVDLLGGGPCRWEHAVEGLRVELPPEAPTRHAAVLRIR
jgi:alpha-L-fucosidase